jgi:DNA mismatch repair protein MutL
MHMSFRRVQILPEHLANQIAAGEVIQRPESVVKELLENSLDAGATSIVVIVKEGGKKLIQVVDDGVGMDEQDAVTAFLRHATSKIASAEDLEAIRTYGFRGEALASIASVAHVTMKTRRREDDTAVVVHIDGGSTPRISREAREPGTSVAVQNLFYNTPARRKFLKSAGTELRHIAEAVQRVALSHPEIALKFISDDEVLLDLKACPLHERLVDVFGERQVEGIVWVEERSDVLSVSGYIGKPSFGQKSRANQFLFLNKRYIISRNISHAVFTAYENLLVKGTFPFFLLFLDIDPHRVDVNVHPSKLEAKFEDEHYVYHFVSSLVRRTLAAHDLIPAMSLRQPQDDAGAIGLTFTNRQHSWGSELVNPATGEIFSPRVPSSEGLDSGARGAMEGRDGLTIVDRLFGEGGSEQPLRAGEVEQETAGTISPSSAGPWQLHKKYILVPIESGLLVVDQHVAHERVLYERALRNGERGAQAVQQLLFPQTLQLAPADFAQLEELLPHFEYLGFAIKIFGRNTIVVEGMPADLKADTNASVLLDVLTLYREYQQHKVVDARDVLAKSYACRTAIKAGDPLNESEMRSLLDQLATCTMPYVCPHGRPVALKLSLEELDRRFGRT